MTPEAAMTLLKDLPGWELSNDSIQREFRFKTYRAGLEFAYAVGMIAEEQDHHPDTWVGWRRVKLIFSTHVIEGLSQNDFIMAAKSEVEYLKHAKQ